MITAQRQAHAERDRAESIVLRRSAQEGRRLEQKSPVNGFADYS